MACNLASPDITIVQSKLQNLYIYIYIYICVCVCVCVCTFIYFIYLFMSYTVLHNTITRLLGY